MPGRLIGAKKTEVNIPDTWRSDGAFMKPNIARLVSSYVLKSYLGYDLQTALLPVSDATPSNHTTAFQQKWYDVEGAEIGGVITTLLDARDDSRQVFVVDERAYNGYVDTLSMFSIRGSQAGMRWWASTLVSSSGAKAVAAGIHCPRLRRKHPSVTSSARTASMLMP